MTTKAIRAPSRRGRQPRRAFPFDGEAAIEWLRKDLRDAQVADRLVRVAKHGTQLSAFLRRVRSASKTAGRAAALLAKARTKLTSPTRDEQLGLDLQSAYLLSGASLLRRRHITEALLSPALEAMRKAEEFLSAWDEALPAALINGRLLFDSASVAAGLAHNDASGLGIKVGPSRLLALAVAVGVEETIESHDDFDQRREGWKKKADAVRSAAALLRKLRSR